MLFASFIYMVHFSCESKQ